MGISICSFVATLVFIKQLYSYVAMFICIHSKLQFCDRLGFDNFEIVHNMSMQGVDYHWFLEDLWVLLAKLFAPKSLKLECVCSLMLNDQENKVRRFQHWYFLHAESIVLTRT